MKKDWTYKKLGEVCEILNGFAFKSSEYVSDGIRVIRITNVQKGYVEDSEPKFYPISTQNELKRYLLFENDLLISLTGNVGRVGLIEKSLLPAYLNQRVGCLRIKKEEELTIPYLYYLLNSNRFENDCILSSRGAAQKNMSTVWLGDYIIPLPPLSEQSRIASRLDAAFGEIEGVKAKAEAQLSEARTLFQSALTEAMKPKQGWEEKKLGEEAFVFSGYAFKSGDFRKQGTYQVLRIGNIKQNCIRLSESPIFLETIDKTTLIKSLLKKGDLVVTQTGTRHKRDYGFVAMVNNENLLLNQRNACVRYNDILSAQFFLYYSYTDFYKDSFFANEGGTVGQGNVGLSALREMTYFVPPLSVQQQIVSRLDALSEKVRELEEMQKKTLAECDNLKKALLREVFE